MKKSAGKVIQLSAVEFKTRLCRRVNGQKEQKVFHFELDAVYPPVIAMEKAMKIREEMAERFRRGELYTNEEMMPPEQVVLEFIEAYRLTHSHETTDFYRNILLKDFVSVVKNGKKIIDVDQDDLEAFNIRMLKNDPSERPHARKKGPLSGDTIDRAVTGVCEFGHWCYDNGYMRSYPFDRLMLDKRASQTATPNYCTPDQFFELCKKLEESTTIAIADKVLVGLCSMAGLRRGEAIGLCWKDWKGEFIRVKTAVESPVGRKPIAENVKNYNEHDVYIPLQLQNILAKYREEVDDYDPNNRILRGEKTKTYLCADVATDKVKKLVRELIGNDLTDDITPHGLRHSYASVQNYLKTELTTIKESLGHKDINTTMIYVHPFDESKKNAAATMGTFLSGKENKE